MLLFDFGSNPKACSMSNIKNKNKLLQDIVDGLGKLQPKSSLGLMEVEVRFVVYEANNQTNYYDFLLIQALDALANDLYFDCSGNWGEATSAEVYVK